jgi:hypothetical protein
LALSSLRPTPLAFSAPVATGDVSRRLKGRGFTDFCLGWLENAKVDLHALDAVSASFRRAQVSKLERGLLLCSHGGWLESINPALQLPPSQAAAAVQLLADLSSRPFDSRQRGQLVDALLSAQNPKGLADCLTAMTENLPTASAVVAFARKLAPLSETERKAQLHAGDTFEN